MRHNPWLSLIIMIVVLVGCGTNPESAETTPEAESTPTVESTAQCYGFNVDNPDALTCVVSGERQAIAQAAPDTRITLTNDELTITVNGTIILERGDDTLNITSVEATNTITQAEESQDLAAGEKLEIDASGFANTQAVNVDAQRLPNLPRTVESVQNIQASDTPRPSRTPDFDATATARPDEIADDSDESVVFDLGDGCQSRLNWQNVYVVKARDVLSIIARRYGTTVEEMVEANCLLNPSRLEVDQVLRVPKEQPNTATPAVLFFRANENTIFEGNCTFLRWEMLNVEAVYLMGEAVSPRGLSDLVCPTEDATYTLRVVFRDGSEQMLETSVEVVQPQ